MAMTIPVAAKLNLALCSAVALGLIASGGAAADAPIYKCTQAGVVLYTDFPRNGGAIVDIHPGVADPAANGRLQRAQAEELDRGAARHRAEEELAAQPQRWNDSRYDPAVSTQRARTRHELPRCGLRPGGWEAMGELRIVGPVRRTRQNASSIGAFHLILRWAPGEILAAPWCNGNRLNGGG